MMTHKKHVGDAAWLTWNNFTLFCKLIQLQRMIELVSVINRIVRGYFLIPFCYLLYGHVHISLKTSKVIYFFSWIFLINIFSPV